MKTPARPCLSCGRPTHNSRCPGCYKAQKQAYKDPGYKRYRRLVLIRRPDCWICGRPGANTVDHVVPLAAGGTNGWDNLRPAHLSCNAGKRDR